MAAAERKFDIVVFGATGFTGALTAEYLARHGGAKLRWALAGRNPEKLKLVRARLGDINPHCRDLELLHADIEDAGSMQAVAQASRVVITTVGPYITYGEPLVAACAAAGTDYVDLTGEPEFVDLMWLRYHEQAKQTGARIVNCCGFDSIPHDLGAYFTVRQLPEGAPLKVEGFVRAGGSFSGGTLHSAVTAFSRLRDYAKVSKARRARESRPAGRTIGATGGGIRYEKSLNAWAVPFPSVDPQVVRRSAAANERYGPEFRYGHYVLIKKLHRVGLLLAGAGAIFAGAQLKFTRNKILAFKNPGQGPSEAQRSKSWFRVRFIGEGGGQRVVTEVSGGDPGYGETSKMLAESALCLAFDKPTAGGGVITPAQAMGEPLMQRLQQAGIAFKVIEAG